MAGLVNSYGEIIANENYNFFTSQQKATTGIDPRVSKENNEENLPKVVE